MNGIARSAPRSSGLRVGLVINVGSDDISEIEAYVTPSTVFEDLTKPVAALPPDVVEAVQKEVLETLHETNRRQCPEEAKAYQFAFHVEVPYGYGFADRFATADGRLTFLRTRILKDRNRRVSAACVQSVASARELAKARAFNDLCTACALFTLANQQRYEITNVNWSRYRPPINVLSDIDAVPEDRYYPLRRKWPDLENEDPIVPRRSEWVWAAFWRLSESDRASFSPALFAYYAASNRKSDLSTLSVVALTAALGSLAGEYRKKCPGSVSCSKCGQLSFKHDVTGEVPAMVDLIVAVCGIARQKRDELQAMLYRVYRKQRSAYVHGAQLRHDEYGQGARLPSHLPTNDAPVQELFEYAQDLSSLRKITHWTLLAWLGSRSGALLDTQLFSINTGTVTSKLLHSVKITFPGAAVIGFASTKGKQGA